MPEFRLDPRLEAETVPITDWPLSQVLLMNDARFPWLILVPRRADAIELHDLSAQDRSILIEEIARAGTVLKSVTGAAKVNVGALGNLVPQLHVHVVARFSYDEAWPGPVWGRGERRPYAHAAREAFLQRLSPRLA